MNQAEMLHRFVTETDVDIIMLPGRYTLLEQGAAVDLLPACLEREVAVVNVGVFNSGLLSKRRPASGATCNYESASQELLDRANQLARICESHGTTLPAAALAYPYQHPAVTSVVLGMRTPDQVKQNFDLAAQPVPQALWHELRASGLIR
jgi:D-threo-aldose 1-dehydrogenase